MASETTSTKKAAAPLPAAAPQAKAEKQQSRLSRMVDDAELQAMAAISKIMNGLPERQQQARVLAWLNGRFTVFDGDSNLTSGIE